MTEKAETLLQEAQQVMAVLDLKLSDHGRHREMIRTNQWALIKKKQLVARYQSPYENQPAALKLHPVRLCLIKQAWYLLAHSGKGSPVKTYRIPRFKTLRMVDEPAQVPEDFDLKGYFGNAWSVYRGDKTYEVKLKFSSDAAPLVTETSWHPTQTVHGNRDGTAIVSFRVDGLNEILWWVLGWSSRVTVLEPPELREMVVTRLQQALSMQNEK